MEFDTMIEDMNDVINVKIPTGIDDDGELCTVISIDSSEYPDFDNTDDNQVLELFMQLRDFMDDMSVFGSEEEYNNCLDCIDTIIEDMMATTMVGGVDVADDDFDKDPVDSDEYEEEPALRIITTTGDIYHTPYASVNWQHNAEHVDSIEEAMCTFQTMVAEMYAGKTSVEDVTDTAESVLDNMSVSTEYEFPMAKDITKREMATIKMFDAFAAYAVIYAQSLMHREKTSWYNTLGDMVNFTKRFVREFKNANDDVGRKTAIEDMEAFLNGFSFLDESKDEVDDEAIADVMEAANDIEGGDVE
jgi:hypothetical protein